jgi:hypothetical protein
MNAVDLTMIALPAGVFCSMMAAAIAGHRLALARARYEDAEDAPGTGAIDAAVLGLLGLLVAFWFSSAGTRLDVRRSLIVEEANAIGTAWLRLDLLPRDAQAEMRGLFHGYVDVRLAQAPGRPSAGRPRQLDDELADHRHAIWGRAVEAALRCVTPQGHAILLESLNEMFDAGTRHQAFVNAHTPTAILALLVVVAACSAALAGHDMGRRRSFHWLHNLVFAGVVAITIWVIYDLEMPRYGLIRVDNFDQTIRDVRADFDWSPKPAPHTDAAR